ncbi:MAG: hypothetical protein E6R03_04095 [Hyphomicrobiaceae bacterium]|nr:MAG: hypothetical protein E6R03_04095 [Hyphomicrobiaceae bacterium]
MKPVFTIAIVVIYSRLAAPLPEVKRMVRQASTIIERDTGIALMPRFQRRRRIPRVDLQNQRLALGSYAEYFNDGDGSHTLLLAPAGISATSGLQGSTGQASICGRRCYVGMVRGTAYSKRMNLIAIVHEVGHMLGASHTDWTGGVMDPAPSGVLFTVGWQSLAFEQRSIDEIRLCSLPTASAL